MRMKPRDSSQASLGFPTMMCESAAALCSDTEKYNAPAIPSISIPISQIPDLFAPSLAAGCELVCCRCWCRRLQLVAARKLQQSRLFILLCYRSAASG
mmetsp:Transcript_58532/g.122315  ORF Transcript_58532/g.122315 Transcript_58532/m.122315 type:complete len:98 (+) Transcript_58532:213-506(+)